MGLKEDLDIIGEAAKKYGFLKFNHVDYQIEFSNEQPKLIIPNMSIANRPIGEAFGMPTDDQMLFASSIPMTDEEIAASPPNG